MSNNIYSQYERWKLTDDFKRWKHRRYLKQGGLCWYCGIFLKGVRINVEHKKARSLGGTNKKSNLVLSCSDCNKQKGSTSLTNRQNKKYNSQNKNFRGTYSRNKEVWESNVKPYTDDGFAEMIKNF